MSDGFLQAAAGFLTSEWSLVSGAVLAAGAATVNYFRGSQTPTKQDPLGFDAEAQRRHLNFLDIHPGGKPWTLDK